MSINLTDVKKMKLSGEKITMLTSYDASFAALCDEAGVDMLLVGDSLGMVVQGHESTLSVSLVDMAYHTRCVARGAKRSIVVGDLPFGAYQASPVQAFESAACLMAAGAHMVKLEGGVVMAETVGFLAARGIPVMGHLGLTPQFVHKLGGFRVQGKTDEAGDLILKEALMLEEAGASALVIECVPAGLGEKLTSALTIPTIGIGAGPACSGQVLVLHDMLDIYPGKKARFVRNFMATANSVQDALAAFVADVKSGTFPGPEHCF